MKIYVCLRDDDTNGLTTVDELINGYGPYWGVLPITLATVPFAHGSERKILEFADNVQEKYNMLREWEKKASVEDLTEYHTMHPIGANAKLVDELKRQIINGKIEIALHGVHHRYNEQGEEMFGRNVSFEAIRDGKEYLEKVFDTPVITFIPPANTIDEKCVSYLRRLNMILYCSGSIWFKNSFQRALSYLKYPDSFIEKFKNKITRRSQAMRKRCGIYMFSSITYDIFKSRESVFKQVKAEVEKTGMVALGTHYRLFSDSNYRKEFYDLIEEIKGLGDVEFVTATQYFNICFKKYYE